MPQINQQRHVSDLFENGAVKMTYENIETKIKLKQRSQFATKRRLPPKHRQRAGLAVFSGAFASSSQKPARGKTKLTTNLWAQKSSFVI